LEALTAFWMNVAPMPSTAIPYMFHALQPVKRNGLYDRVCDFVWKQSQPTDWYGLQTAIRADSVSHRTGNRNRRAGFTFIVERRRSGCSIGRIDLNCKVRKTDVLVIFCIFAAPISL
jgi:hypothetical protein